MVLEKLRDMSDNILSRVSKPFLRLSPNLISSISLVIAILAGAVYYLDLVLLGGVLVLLNGFFDALDGYIARVTNRASQVGDLIDHTFDRLSDIAIMLGLTYSTFINDTIGFMSIIVVLLVSYMGTQAQALGVGRIYTGIIGRADRILLIGLLSIVQGLLGDKAIFYRFTILDILFIYFIVAGVITFAQRFVITYNSLSSKEKMRKK